MGRSDGGFIDSFDTRAICVDNSFIEVFAFRFKDSEVVYPTGLQYAFRNMVKLKKIIGIINCINIKNSNSRLSFTDTFSNCPILENVLISSLPLDISFKDSPLLSLESLRYLINNAANTSPITVTVHSDVYAKIQDETNTDWHALIETAAAKQITFATA